MQKVNGLIDREQAILVLISGLLITVGTIAIPSDFSCHEYVGILLALLGAVDLR